MQSTGCSKCYKRNTRPYVKESCHGESATLLVTGGQSLVHQELGLKAGQMAGGWRLDTGQMAGGWTLDTGKMDGHWYTGHWIPGILVETRH